MKKIKALALIALTIAVMLLTLTSCDVAENVLGQIPGVGDLLHKHTFVEGKCECGETDPDFVHTHTFTDGKCECGEREPGYSCINHVWGEPVLESEATCTKEGRHVITCTECGYQRYTPIFALGHDDDEVTVEATCTTDGLHTKTCKRCGDVREEVLPATGHALSNNVYEITVEPTCTEKGVIVFPCANCDYTESYEIPALGHHFVDGECECGEKFVPTVIEGDWALVTELKTGDRVLIGNVAYGKLLSADKVSAGSYYNKGVDFSADNFENVTDAEIWIVTVNNDGTYSFESLTGEKLGMAASYSSLNSAGPNFSWSLTAKDETTFLIKNTARGNYLEWYASKGNWSTYSAGNTTEYYLSFYAKSVVEDPNAEHVHNYISDAHAPTCTEDGYTTYTCRCGETYTEAGDPATGHAYAEKVVAPTCTEDGYTDHTCGNCGDNYKTDEVAAEGHKYSEGTCSVCGGEDPDWHVHQYNDVVTLEPTCTVPGSKVPTCECGDTLAAIEIPVVDHVDANLDITCDFEGCTKRIIPAADSKVSLFTANHMIIVSLSGKYYVEGTVTEVVDAKNGNFVITDAEGYTFFIRMPVDADGLTHANWVSKVVVGDVVSVYGTPKTTSGWNTTIKAGMQSGVLTFLEKHPHDFTFKPAGCSDPAYCACGQPYGEPLGCADTDGDDLCDDCGKNVKYVFEYVEIRTDNGSGVHDATALTYTWGNDNFGVQVAKANGGNLYTTSKDHMRLYKGNTLTLINKNGLAVKMIIVHLTNATNVGYFEKFLTGYDYTVDSEKFTISIAVDSVENIVFTNPSSNGSTTQVKGIEIGYEKAVVKAEPVTVTMANTITDVQSTNMTGGNDAELVGLDSSIFSVVADKGSYGNYPVLYYKSTLAAPSQIRLYNHSSANGSAITVSVAEGYEIVSIKITFAITGRANGYVITNGEGVEIANVATDATIENVEAIYDVNSGSFTLKNVHTGNSKQVWIASIEITYQEV